ncbi:hypothetical protein FA95DRAFT_1578266, partial [Auriscalpium vulgare]
KGVGQYTPSPTSPSRGRTAAWLITGSPTTPTKRARPSRRALADVVEQSFETVATAGSSPAATSSVSAPLPRTNAGPRLPVKYEDGGIFTQATPKKRSASLDGEGTSPFEYDPLLHKDEAFIGKLLMWYKPDTIQKAYSAPPLSDDDVDDTLARLTNFKMPGISFMELIRAVGRCPMCGLIMAHELLPVHGCRFNEDEDGEGSSAPGPSKKRKLDKPAVPRRSFAYMANGLDRLPNTIRTALSVDDLKGKGKDGGKGRVGVEVKGKGRGKVTAKVKAKAKAKEEDEDESLFHIAYDANGKEINVIH